MILSDLSIRRPVLATVMSLVLTLVGAVSFGRLSVREYPSIDVPVVTVQTFYQGASADIMETQVTRPLEDSLSGIGDDRDIVIELDGQWLIPEYEPETGRVRSGPLEPLERGRHHLGIQVTDRAGNKTEQYLNFSVKRAGKRPR